MKYYIKLRTSDAPETSPFSSGIHQCFLDRSINIRRDHEQLHSIYFYDDKVKNNSRAVRLEDLHNAPRAVLSAICRWLGLDWNDTLLESTYAGLQWWNRPGIKRVSGFDKSIVSTANHTFTDAFDERRLAFVGHHIMREYYPEALQCGGGDMPTWMGLVQCVLPFRLELKNFDYLRAQFIMGRHLRKVWPSYGAFIEQDAGKQHAARKSSVEQGANVVVKKTSGLDTLAKQQETGSSATWYFRKPDGGIGSIVFKDFVSPDPVHSSFVLLALNADLALRRWAGREHRYEGRSPSERIKKLANRYCFVVDYIYNRYLIIKAIRYIRRHRASQVPLLYSLPVVEDVDGGTSRSLRNQA